MADLLAPELAIPFRLVGNGVAEVEQDSDEEITQGAILVLRYEIGERPAIPRFGIEDPTFAMKEANARGMIAAVTQWEPNATIEIVQSIVQSGTLDVQVTIDTTEPTDG